MASASPMPTHARLATASLAVGGFALGIGEFVMMGMLTLVRNDLGITAEQAGLGISAYAVGVVIGAPTITALGARARRRTLILITLAIFIVGAFLTAVAPSLPLFVTGRLIAGIPHAAYFGIAGFAASELVDTKLRGRAIAGVLLGVTIANLVGVPVFLALGQATSWRISFAATGAVAAIAALLVAWTVPRGQMPSDASKRREFTGLRTRSVWLITLLGTVGFGGIFCVYSYIAPIATAHAGVSESLLPVVTACFGLGMTLGTIVSGRLANRSPRFAVIISFAAMFASLLAFSGTSELGPLIMVGTFAIGFTSQLLGAPLQLLLIDAAPQAPALAGAMHHAAFNLANAVGAVVGGAVLSISLAAPALVGTVFPVLGLLFFVCTSTAMERSVRRARSRYGVESSVGSIAVTWRHRTDTRLSEETANAR